MLTNVLNAISKIREDEAIVNEYFPNHNEEHKKHFLEFSDHLKEHVTFFHKTLAGHNGEVKLVGSKKFRIEQWDKSKIETFFLGNYLSCCLATNGTYFPAMVQRRMDQAMFMHVIIDEEINEPVCGN